MWQLSAPLTVAWSCFAPGCAGWMLTLQGLMDIEMQLGCGAEGCCRAPWWAWADLARSPTSSPASGHHRGAPRLGHGAPGIASPLLPPTLLTGSFFLFPQDSHKLFFCYKIASNSTQCELSSEASRDSSPCLLPPLLPSPAARSPSGAVFIPLSSLIGNVCKREGTYA